MKKPITKPYDLLGVDQFRANPALHRLSLVDKLRCIRVYLEARAAFDRLEASSTAEISSDDQAALDEWSAWAVRLSGMRSCRNDRTADGEISRPSICSASAPTSAKASNSISVGSVSGTVLQRVIDLFLYLKRTVCGESRKGGKP